MWCPPCRSHGHPHLELRREKSKARVGQPRLVHSSERRMSESWKQEFVTYLGESTSATPLVSQALAVKELNVPPRIYKYRCDNSYTRTNLETNCVWTCSPAKYNDPYDSWLSMPSNVLAQLLEQSLEKKTGNAKKYSGGVSQVALSTAKNLKI